MIRTNISSLWYYPRLTDLLEKNNRTFFGGHLHRDFLSGNGMIMTPDLVQYLINTYDEYKPQDTISDDVRISHIIRRIFPQDQWTTIPYLFYNQENIQEEDFHSFSHYYCKGGGTDEELNQKVCNLLWGEDFQAKEIWGKVKEVEYIPM